MKTSTYQIIAFAQVMQEGSFSAAAQKMGVTQSALSQHVGKLEQQVGARLIARSPTGLALTPAGTELFELAERFASLSTEIDEKLLGYSNFDTGHLNIIANAPQPALSSITHYGRAFPKVEINFTLFDWTRTMAMLSDHSVDIAFITRPRFNKDCVYKKLCEATYVMYLPADHALASRRTVSLQEVSAETLILPERGSLTQKVVSQALAKHGVTPRRHLNTTTFPVMKEAILMGSGIGIFLSNAAAPHEGLVQVPIDELDERFEIFAAAPKHKFGLRLVKSFWNELDDYRAP